MVCRKSTEHQVGTDEDTSYLHDLQRLQKGVIQTLHKLITNKVSYRHRDERADATHYQGYQGDPAQPWFKSWCLTFGKQQLLCRPLADPFAVVCTETLTGLADDMPPTLLCGSLALSQSSLSSSCRLSTQKSQHFGKGAVPPALCCTSIVHQSWGFWFTALKQTYSQSIAVNNPAEAVFL